MNVVDVTNTILVVILAVIVALPVLGFGFWTVFMLGSK